LGGLLLNVTAKMLSILRKARLKDKEMRILMLWAFLFLHTTTAGD
jgi:hypothetical protein